LPQAEYIKNTKSTIKFNNNNDNNNRTHVKNDTLIAALYVLDKSQTLTAFALIPGI